MIIKGLDKWILPVYQPYLRDYHTRINVYYGGAGSGKSHFVVQKLILKALQMERKTLVVRKTGTTLRDSVWTLFLRILGELGNVIKAVNKSDFTITLINGSVFLFKGLDDREKIKSIDGISDIFIEEATELTPTDYDQLNLRLRSKKPFNQIHLAFNPVSKANWCYQYFFANGAPDNCVVVQTTYKDNHHLPQEYINTLLEMEERNPAYYKIYALGQFATLDKLVFPKYEKRLISNEEVKGLEFWCGMDFGYVNDPTAITWGFYERDKRILYIYGEFNEKNLTNDILAEHIKRLGLSKERIVADCAEPKSIEEIRRLGITHIRACVKGADSVLNGIDKLLRCKIIIDERCVHTLEEFDNYTWCKDKWTNEYINVPIDAYNHHIDSIRYGTQGVITEIAIKPTRGFGRYG